ncbi:MAG: DUF493 domain-containing protein [Lautropia sp.]|nr:DUF493 domain-containing protein [Lautropia sp.]
MRDTPAGTDITCADPMQFPMSFPIKIMGRNVEGFIETVSEIISRHAEDFNPAALQTRTSRSDTYLSLTATFTAHSRAQLDSLYSELSAHEMVSVVL